MNNDDLVLTDAVRADAVRGGLSLVAACAGYVSKTVLFLARGATPPMQEQISQLSNCLGAIAPDIEQLVEVRRTR